jgi:hypothetical protein
LIPQAADELATEKSGSTSDPVRRCDSIDWLCNLNAMERRDRDLFPATQFIDSPHGAVSAFNESESLPLFFPVFSPAVSPAVSPVSGRGNTANAPPANFKIERWRTNRAVIGASIFEAAWLTADGITTARMSRGATEAGSAWAYGKHPTPGRVAGMMAVEFVGIEASSYVLHKMKAPKWIYIAPMIVSGSLHASGAIPNLKNGQ